VFGAVVTWAAVQCCTFVKSRQLDDAALSVRNSAEGQRLQEGLDTFVARGKVHTKIVYSFWQVVGLLGSVYGVKYPPMYQSMLSNVKVFVTLGIQYGTGCVGFDFLDTMRFMTLVPLAMAVVMLFVGVAAKESVRKRIMSAVLLLSYMILPAVSATIFQVRMRSPLHAARCAVHMAVL